jgi:hypothetical protein
MTKMEIEFTDEQLEKIELLESYDIGVGDAIDMLFEVMDRVLSIIEDIDENTGVTVSDEDSKSDNAEETPQNAGKTYDEALQDYKHHVSWAKDFFKI